MGTTPNVGAMTVQLSMLGIVVGDMPAALRFYRLLGLDIPAEADEQPFVIHRMDSGVSLFFDTVFARTFDPDHRLPEGAGYSSLFEFYLGDDAGVDAVRRRTRRRGIPRPDGAGADPGPVRRDGRRPRRARDLADL